MDIQLLQDYAPILLAIALWDLVWKSLALWHAARKGAKVWFVILLVVNSIGILPIIYLFMSKSLTLSGTPTIKEEK